MMTRIGRTDVSEQDLQLYFDGELTGAEAQELAAHIEAEPELKRELEQLGVLKELIGAGLMAKAEEVPAARFEQIWDEIDRVIERDARAKKTAAEGPISIWSRVNAALRPVRFPAAAAVAAAAAAVLVMRFGSGDPNIAEEPASVAVATPEQQGAPVDATPEPSMKSATPSTDSVAERNAAVPSLDATLAFEPPKPAQADIERIEFGGNNGRISQTGTVTVLHVEEDVEHEDSERSL